MSEMDFDFFPDPLPSAREGGERPAPFQITARHLTDQGVVAESLLMALATGLLGRHAERAAGETGAGARPTLLSLSCDMVSQAGDGDRLEGTARIMRQTRTMLFISGELCLDGKPVVVATGIWKIHTA